jgi:Tfp pilus assembly protein PilF
MPFSKLIILLLGLFILQACSLLGKPEDSNVADESADIKSIGQDIIDMGVILKTNSKTTIQNEAVNVQPLSSPLALEETQYQQFLAQQTLMKNTLPAVSKARYQLALKQMKRKNWQAATVLLDEIIAQDPKFSGAHLNKALSQYHLKKFDLAMLSLKAAEKVNVINPYSYNLQGVLAREQGKFSEAETYYLKALKVWPDYPEAHLNIAVLFELYRGKFVKAKAHYQAYLLLKPDDQKTKQWLAGLEIKIASRKDS